MYVRFLIPVIGLVNRLAKYLLIHSTLLAGAVIVPITYLVIAASIEIETGKWTLQLYTPPTYGFVSVYLATDDKFVPLRATNTFSTSEGNFCTCFDCPQLDHADLRVLVPGQTRDAQPAKIAAQFVSYSGNTRIVLPPVIVPPYSIKVLRLRSKDDRMGPADLPRLTRDPLTLPPPAGEASRLHWLLFLNCVVIGVLYFVCIKTKGGLTCLLRIMGTPIGISLQKLFSQNLFLFVLGCNAVLFYISFAVFAHRYEADDDPAMAMIACGRLTGHPSEYLVYINVITGLLLKWLYIQRPLINWYFVFIAIAMIGSSAIIGTSLIRICGLARGVFLYIVVLIFFILHGFCELQYTTAGAFTCLAGLTLVLSSEQAEASSRRFTLLASILLVTLGSLIRYEAALLIIALTILPLLVRAIHHKRYSYILFLCGSLIAIQSAHYFNAFYYSHSSEWKYFYEYSTHFGHLEQRPRFDKFADNRAVYESIGWNKNDFDMISWQWLYQDPKVFSLKNIAYLDEHLVTPPERGLGIFTLLRPIWSLYGMPLILLFYLFHNWQARRLSPLSVIVILAPLIAILVHLSSTAHLPDRVFIPAIFAAFLLSICFSKRDLGQEYDSTPFKAYYVSICLFMMFSSILSLLNSAQVNMIKTGELKESLARISFLKDKVLLSSISSIFYESLPPYENWWQFKDVNFIDIMWTYPSPDVLSAFRRNDIDRPFVDLAKGDKTLLLVPTFAWDRGAAMQQFLLDHYHLKVDYEIVKDPDGRPCCYTNFTVLRFFPSNVSVQRGAT